MEDQANTTREQINKKNIYDVGWRPSHGKNEGVGKKKIYKTCWTLASRVKNNSVVSI